MISKCHHVSVGDKNHIFSIVQRPQRSGGQTMPLAIPRAVSGDQSRGLAAEILFRPRGRGFFHSLSQNHSATPHQSTTTTLQHHNIKTPQHHHTITTVECHYITTTSPQHHNTTTTLIHSTTKPHNSVIHRFDMTCLAGCTAGASQQLHLRSLSHQTRSRNVPGHLSKGNIYLLRPPKRRRLERF